MSSVTTMPTSIRFPDWSGPTSITKSVWSSERPPASEFSTAWRMSSSEIPCLRALARISTPTRLVVGRISGNGQCRHPTIGSHGRTSVQTLRSSSKRRRPATHDPARSYWHRFRTRTRAPAAHPLNDGVHHRRFLDSGRAERSGTRHPITPAQRHDRVPRRAALPPGGRASEGRVLSGALRSSAHGWWSPVFVEGLAVSSSIG